jgi:hypothetical protein
MAEDVEQWVAELRSAREASYVARRDRRAQLRAERLAARRRGLERRHRDRLAAAELRSRSENRAGRANG